MECQIKTSKRLSAIDLFTGSFFLGGGLAGWFLFGLVCMCVLGMEPKDLGCSRWKTLTNLFMVLLLHEFPSYLPICIHSLG